MESDHELTVFCLIQTRVTKQLEKRRRRRQRRREQKQQLGCEASVDDELTVQMQVCTLHEPKEINLEEGCEPEQIDLPGSFEEDRINS